MDVITKIGMARQKARNSSRYNTHLTAKAPTKRAPLYPLKSGDTATAVNSCWVLTVAGSFICLFEVVSDEVFGQKSPQTVSADFVVGVQ